MHRQAETAIGVDIGGTRVRAALISTEGAVLARASEPTDRTRHGVVAQVVRLVDQLRVGSSTAVGLGLPGRVDGPGQRIVSAGYLDIAGLDIAAAVRDATGLPVRIENDATMALIAEVRVRGSDGLVLMVTVGTGIGGAVSRGGAPWYGGGFAGQFGHLVVAADGPLCKCGRRGCVETLSSGTALGRLTAEAGWPEGTTAQDLIDAADAGRTDASALLDLWAAPFERALQSLVATLDPELIVLGGGLGEAMTQTLARRDPASPWFPLPVEAAKLGDEAGVIGAGLAALGACAA